MLFNLARQIPLLIKDGFPLNFDTDYVKYRGIELKGKTVGIIGLGYNGRAIADRCLGLGMDVIHWSRSSTEALYERVEMDELMSTADVIIPTFAKNDDTDDLITEDRLRCVKPSTIIIDIIGLNSVQQVILDMVKSGKLFSYGFEAEPKLFGGYDGNVWAAPAYAWATDGSMNRSMEKWIDNMMSTSQSEYPMRVN